MRNSARRRFPDEEQIAKEAGRSRIYGGIHVTSANEQGAVLGKKVAIRVMEHSGQAKIK